jgi:hypothetical protein
MTDLLVRGQEIGAVRGDLPPETIERVMHAIGKELSADIIDGGDAMRNLMDKDVCLRVEKFMNIMHDLSQRILTPGEV